MFLLSIQQCKLSRTWLSTSANTGSLITESANNNLDNTHVLEVKRKNESIHSPSKESSLINVQRKETESTAKEDRPASLGNLPKEVMIMIFESLESKGDLATRVSLGLTCRSLYSILKHVHPAPISIMNIATFPSNPWRNQTPKTDQELMKVVAGFLGNKYRGLWAGLGYQTSGYRRAYRSYHFLNIDVYGEDGSEAQRRFEDRMREYVEMQYVCDDGTVIQMLPCPLGKGDDWYDEVAAHLRSLFPRQRRWDFKSVVFGST